MGFSFAKMMGVGIGNGFSLSGIRGGIPFLL